jgi:hypothetical protein
MPEPRNTAAVDHRRHITYGAAGRDMKQVTIRLELRVPEEMHEYLQTEAHSRKLSFEGLLLMYIEDRMKSDKDRRHSGPARA